VHIAQKTGEKIEKIDSLRAGKFVIQWFHCTFWSIAVCAIVVSTREPFLRGERTQTDKTTKGVSLCLKRFEPRPM
jgi:hypothetical protein